MKHGTVALLFAACLLAGFHEATAQKTIEVGPRAGFDLVGDADGFFVGADGRVAFEELPVLLDGTFDVYFADSGDFFQLSINALYEFGVDNKSYTPYAGLGLGISRGLDKTDAGLNLIGGAIFGSGTLRPFVQAQITIGELELFTLGGGVLLKIAQ